MTSSVHFSSKTDNHATPQALFDTLHAEFGFTLDVCASAANAKCAAYITAEQDAMLMRWHGVCWMNPPYGNAEHVCKPGCKKNACVKRGYHNLKYKAGIEDFMRKAVETAQAGSTVVCLVPARTDTHWWWNYARLGQIRFIKGRLKFGHAAAGAPFPSAIVVFYPYFPLLAEPFVWGVTPSLQTKTA